ncbi:MAG: adenylate/guanylate cyclase domain-containing protein [Cyanobacteriota bacterium]|nr:adenylate/guanylate cyclase domain-containing protein [Cyanobacteriota bacterium]
MDNFLESCFKFSIFGEFSVEEVDIIYKYLSFKTFENGQILLKKGGNSDYWLIIARGQVSVVDEGVAIARRAEGDLLGEIAWVRSSSHMADAVAASDGEIALMTFNNMLRLQLDFPRVAIKLADILTRSTLDKLNETAIALRRRERYAETLVEVQRELMRCGNESDCYESILQLLGVATEVARIDLLERQEDAAPIPQMRPIARWNDRGVELNLANRGFLEQFSEVFSRGKVAFALAHHFPETEGRQFQEQGLFSLFLFPIAVRGELFGLLSCALAEESRAWDGAELDLLRSVTAALGLWKERQLAQRELQVERDKCERLLLNVLPAAIARQLKENPNAIAEYFEEVTILFADIVGFTPLAAEIPPTELVNLLNEIFSTFDRLTERYALEKIKTIGDAYMVVGGLPLPRSDHAEAIAELALDLQRAIASFQGAQGEIFSIRIGINTGSVVAGVIGISKFTYDLWGDAVNVAARMESTGEAGRIQVTDRTYQHLKDRYCFEQRGAISVRGRGEMTTYWLQGKRRIQAPEQACEL